MALASVELRRIGDRGRGHFGIPDVNGPFIYAVLEAQGCDVDFLGAMEDNGQIAAEKILSRLQGRQGRR
ncbi:hypothetical protein RJ035_001032 [Blastomyces gilchristii]